MAKRNFDILEGIKGFGQLYSFCKDAEQWQWLDSMRSAQCARLALETMVKTIYYINHWVTKDRITLFERVSDPRFVDFINSSDTMRRIHYVRRTGNNAMHPDEHKVSRKEAFFTLINLYYFVGSVLQSWHQIKSLPKFNDTLIPKSQAEIEPSSVIISAKQEVIDTAINKGAEYAAKTASESKKKIGKFKPKKPTEISEWETRKLYIDLLLEEAGWKVLETKGLIKPCKACIEIEVPGMPNPSGVGYADYVLYGPNGIPLAVIEAKKTSKDPAIGRKQAELYAEKLAKKYGCPRPVIYYTNGFEINLIDGLGYPPRSVLGFHTLKDLEWIITQRNRKEIDIDNLKIKDSITDRNYQKRVIRSVCTHYKSMHRRSLLVMATGTGKTRVSISLVDVLINCGWVKNILFLADRTELVKQAYKNFMKLLPSTTCSILMSKRCDKSAQILLSTYQTMIGYIDAEAKEFSIGRFDLLIIDEAHRSVFGKYGALFAYYDALMLGLTATPRDEVEKSTYELFGLEQGVPTDSYEYDEAVADGYLVPYRVFNRKSRIIKEGIKVENLTEEGRKELEEIYEYEKAIHMLEEDSRDIDPKEIFSYIHNIATIDIVIDDLMTNGIKVDDGATIGKTIIFAYNHRHAALIAQRFGELYPQLGPDFCRVIDNYEKYSDQLLTDFEVTDHLPQIAVSVDMLDTGIDVPEVVNLVFFKPVRSKIKFEQMIGRGTRLRPNLFGPEDDKKEFLIFDYWDNFDYFKIASPSAEMPMRGSIVGELFKLGIDIKYALQDAKYQTDPKAKAFHDELAQQLCKQVDSLNRNAINVRQKIELVETASNPKVWECISLSQALDFKELSMLFVNKISDLAALRFDALMLRLQLETLDYTQKSGSAKTKVICIAESLKKKASIPQVAEKIETLNMVTTPEFWKDKTLYSLEFVRNELRDLVQYLDEDFKGRTFVINIEDEVDFSREPEAYEPKELSYRQKVEDYLRENKGRDPILQKIYNLESLEPEDLRHLEEIFWKDLGTKEDFHRTARPDSSIAAFIRTIIKVDKDLAIEKYRTLIRHNEMTQKQEEFLRLIINYVCENGDIHKELLVQAPFDQYAIPAIFGDQSTQLVTYINHLHNSIA